MGVETEITRLETTKADLKAWANETLTTIDDETIDAYPGILEGATDSIEDALDALNGTDTVSVSSGGFTGHVDAVGLAEIGWNETDMAYYQERVWWNEEDDDLWKVSDAEKTDYVLLLAGSEPLLYSAWRWFPKIDYTLFSSGSSSLSLGFYDVCPYLVGVPQTWNGDAQITELQVLASLEFIPVFEHLALTIFWALGCNYLKELSGFDTSGCTTMAIYANPMLRSITGIDATLAIEVDEGDGELIIGGLPNLMRCEIANLGENIDLSESVFLSYDSLVYMMSHAQTVTGKTMLFGDYNLSKLTDEEIAVATGKGWTVL